MCILQTSKISTSRMVSNGMSCLLEIVLMLWLLSQPFRNIEKSLNKLGQKKYVFCLCLHGMSYRLKSVKKNWNASCWATKLLTIWLGPFWNKRSWSYKKMCLKHQPLLFICWGLGGNKPHTLNFTISAYKYTWARSKAWNFSSGTLGKSFLNFSQEMNPPI